MLMFLCPCRAYFGYGAAPSAAVARQNRHLHRRIEVLGRRSARV